MQLEIVTPEKIVFQQDNVDEIITETLNGQIAILPNHVNLVTQVIPGEMIIKIKGKEEYLAVTGGFLEVFNNKATLLADHAVKAEHIVVEKALEAQKRAEETLKRKEEGISEKDLAMASAELRKSILELKVATRRKAPKGTPGV